MLAAGLLVAGNVGTASAHLVSDYPALGWKYTVLSRVFYQAPTKWPATYNARTQDAMATWTNLSGSSLSFSLGPVATTDSWSCGTAWDLVTTDATLASGVLARTTQCSTQNNTARIRLNPDYTWYTGSATPNPSSQQDLQGVLTHELGHAHQAWGVCTDGLTNDPCRGMHYDSTYNAALCDSTNPQGYHTMCSSALAGTNGYRWRPLESHDIDLVEAMY